MPQVPGDSFCSVAPEDNLLPHVDDAHTRGKTLKNAATDIGIVETRHGSCVRDPFARVFIGKIHRAFRGPSKIPDRGNPTTPRYFSKIGEWHFRGRYGPEV